MTGYETIHLSEEYVLQLEDSYINKLFEWFKELETSKCQCPNCQKARLAVKELLELELERLKP